MTFIIVIKSKTESRKPHILALNGERVLAGAPHTSSPAGIAAVNWHKLNKNLLRRLSV